MESKQQKPMKRVLALCDFACVSGFSQVAQNIVRQVLADQTVEYYFDIVAINYYGLPSEWSNVYPRVRLFPAAVTSNGDLFGRFAFVNMLATGVYDIAWVLQDTFIVENIAQKIVDLRTEMVAAGKKPFKWIYYYPIDARPMENWITKSVSLADLPVVYTQYGYTESIRHDPALTDRLRVISHGVETEVFKPLPPAEVAKFRHDYFAGLADGKYLVTNVNRNQIRKDIARTMQIFRLFKNQVPNAVLYLHMKANDAAYNLDEVARCFELIPDADYIIPKGFDENQGLPVELVNAIYNASDIVMTTTLGEGWGLSMTEAQAAGTPVIAPNHTSLTEMLGEGKGTLVTAGKTASEWLVMGQDNARLRPIVNVAEYVEKLIAIHHNPAPARAMALTASQYVKEHLTWEIVGAQWRDLFKTAVPAQKKVTIGRNDPCSCSSGKKWKHCHGGIDGGL